MDLSPRYIKYPRTIAPTVTQNSLISMPISFVLSPCDPVQPRTCNLSLRRRRYYHNFFPFQSSIPQMSPAWRQWPLRPHISLTRVARPLFYLIIPILSPIGRVSPIVIRVTTIRCVIQSVHILAIQHSVSRSTASTRYLIPIHSSYFLPPVQDCSSFVIEILQFIV